MSDERAHDFWLPDEPDVPETQIGRAQGPVRYEDVAQDGRVMLLALPHSIGLAVWQKLLAHDDAARETQRSGIIPILTRIVVEGTDASISVRKPLEYEGRYQMFHTAGGDGAPNRIMLNMWTRAYGPLGRTYGPPPPGAGERAAIGRVFAEHVFTRLFAPPAERKVLRLEAPGRPAVPPAQWQWHAPDALASLPPGAAAVDAALAPDEVALAFGLAHTDSNQHVNSLVYPRLFEEAALRRFARLGRDTTLLARRLEVAYRKPLFAGARARIWLRAFEQAGRLGVAGAFLPEPGDPTALRAAHAFCRMWFW